MYAEDNFRALGVQEAQSDVLGRFVLLLHVFAFA